MTDIVPLVAHAWNKSFGNIENAKKAIAQRGWGPLNFVLLDHPEVRKAVHENIASNPHLHHTSTSFFDVDSVNHSTGFAGDIMSKIVCEHLKDGNRIATLNEKKRKMSEASSNIEKLKMLTRISSGSLAGVGRYHITADIKDIVKEDRMAKKMKEQEKENKRQQKKQAEAATYFESMTKYKNKKTLTGKDIRAILNNHRQPDDSPTSAKIKDLRKQFERRQQRLFDSNFLPLLAPNGNHESSSNIATKSNNFDVDNDDSNSIDSYAEEQCASALFLFSQCNPLSNATSDEFLEI
jgi:hypothetical protein